MGRNNIEKFSKRYAILKSIFKIWHNNFFYRRVIVLGRDNINPEDNLIFAPNHQNALMDALAVLFTLKGQPVFLARADVFKKKFIASILYSFKILPVYRIRDGYGTLKENDEIFKKTIDVLKNRNGLVILPEGNHEGFRRLRQLKKGICRIAFQADNATENKLPIKIIPVGLEYSNYQRFRQVLTVVYGKPIPISEYRDAYKDKPETALVQLRDRLSDEMKKIMVHIESEEDYDAINELRSIINEPYSDNLRFPKLFRDKVLIEKLNRTQDNDPKLYKKIIGLALSVKENSQLLNIDYRLLRKKKHTLFRLIAGILSLIATFPLFLFGNIFSLTFLDLSDLSIRNIKDKQFHSSIRYGASLILMFIFTPIYLILSFVLFSPWWLSVAVFLSLPFSGLFTWHYYLWLRRIRGGFRVKNYIKKGDSDYMKLKEEFDHLVSLVRSL
ncbi:MAG TPA: hypothetical protein GXZ49_09035 [Bacteroidetes bacterium]|nr:hypothetical protein [Bacteroidota bacterium]